MSYWQGKRAVITGGSAGLGRALAGALIERGARVAIVARRQSELDQAAAELSANGGDVLAISADVTSGDDVARMRDEVLARFGGVDLFGHCAGRSMRGDAIATSIDDYRSLWELNFLAAVRSVQVFADELLKSRGHIVLVGSLAAKVAPRYLGAYPTSKFPLAALAQQLRLSLGNDGVHTLLVLPGPIARATGELRYTEQAEGLPPTANLPAGGAKIPGIPPEQLAQQMLQACERGKSELIVPAKARILFTLSQLSPTLGDWLLRKNMAE